MAEEDEKSLLYKLKPITTRMPAVKKPEGHVHFRRKMLWLIVILVVYFSLTNVTIYGLDPQQTMDMFEQFRAIFAGESGSIVHLGISPIVNASIMMQLFNGADIVNLDMKDEDDKAVYQSTQKFLVIIMIFVQAIPQVFGYLEPDSGWVIALDGVLSGQGLLLARILIVAQIALGCYLLFLMDEVVSKWGIGSGISLFILAGVAQGIFTGTLNWEPYENGIPGGTIPKTIHLVQQSSASELSGGTLETILIQNPNPVIALASTILVFLLVAYVQATRVELPLSHGRARGARGRYPLKLIYASVIPVILVSALLANINLFAMLFYTNESLASFPLIGGKWWIGMYNAGQTEAVGGGAWYISRVEGIQEWLLPLISDKYSYLLTQGGVTHTKFQVIMKVIGHFTFMTVFAILFANFWVKTTNMDAESVADQIQDSGMQIPGFRRDPRVLRKVLERYIPTITNFSGFFIGALAATANMLGTVGNASGVSLFLAVSILTELYEQMGKEQMMEMHPVLRDFFGNQ
ncbi:MAG: preprotein translocase subunit SecY [Thermoplasmatota archaeon]